MPLPPDDPNDEERQEELPEDGQTPFSQPDPVSADPAASDDDDQLVTTEDETVGIDGGSQPSTLDDTHPVTDSDVEEEDVYDEGISGAANAEEPNAGNAVVGYNPDEDPDEKDEESNPT